MLCPPRSGEEQSRARQDAVAHSRDLAAPSLPQWTQATPTMDKSQPRMEPGSALAASERGNWVTVDASFLDSGHLRGAR